MFIIIFIFLIIMILTAIYTGAREYLTFTPVYSRLIPEKYIEYKPGRAIETKIALKLGQRKLLFNEIEFYLYTENTFSKGKKIIVIYAGAAPGYHSAAIMELFPHITFKYYDPREFYDGLYSYKNLEIYREYFTATTAQKLYEEHKNRDYTLLFLSDIRNGKLDEVVGVDMDDQYEWCKILKPDYAMLKFRLPWRSGYTEYFTGKIYTQPRIGASSTETRLWTDCKKTKKYSNDIYNNRLYYWQTVSRNAWYKFGANIFDKIEGLDHCHDCWSEYTIMQEYITAYPTSFEDIIEALKFCEKYTAPINIPPHGIEINEKDIYAKMKRLKNITKAYVQSLIEKEKHKEKK